FLSASADGGELYTSGGHLTWVPPSKEPKVIPGRTAGVLSGDGKTVWTQRWLDEYRTDLQRWQWGENNPHYETAIRGTIWSTSFDGTGILGMVQGVPMRNVRLLEIGAQKQSDIRLLQHPRWNLYRAYFSPDSQWVAFTAVKEDESRWLMLAPFRTVGAVPPEDWIEIAEGVSHQFSLDGNALYFLSGRDGFGCIYVVHLDPTTKRPAGPPKAVLHLHGNGPNAQSMPASAFRIGVSKLGLHFSLGEEETQVVHYQ
ncbi:MAG: hypothetical protein JST65_09880, partial [Acidobacteria bacterium]|nr:hypothetical protein [Acidobacteriota bacterium]